MTFLEKANELLDDVPYEHQVAETAQALAAAYEQGIHDAATAAISLYGAVREDLYRELNNHYRTGK